MMPKPGTYKLEKITMEEFKSILKKSEFESYIGYEETADFISKLTGIPIKVSRESTVVENGDILLIIKLPYRVKNVKEKGSLTPTTYEFFVATYSSI